MSAAIDKYKSLVEKLYERTTEKNLSWDYDADDKWVYIGIAGRTLFVEEKKNDDLEPIIEIDIRSGSGDDSRSEIFTDETLDGKPSIAEFSTYYELMASLYNMAKRQATGADEDVDAILSELNSYF